ncbi:MAG: DUF362 domain-containing protein [Candidatus Doudnabacteria bacterium]|nr:DUF362 domain-containing protein [Candidatus Doudnabacteria bacterium]
MNSLPPQQRAAVHHTDTYDYPNAPFEPGERFPECVHLPYEQDIRQGNVVYAHVRESLELLGLDAENRGTPEWNPFKDLVRPGQHTTIKPNLVRAVHPLGEEGTKSMISQAAVIRPLVDYVLLATKGEGTIVIGDVPLQSSNWEKIIEGSGLKALVEFYAEKGINIELLDLRKEISQQNKDGVIIDRDFQDRDPRGYTAVNIGADSRLMPVIEHAELFEITDYGKGTVPPHHNKEVNEYYVPNSVLQADFFLNVPKLKTHRKAGLTCAMKNLIGINGDKRWLAHHRRGSTKHGGDEYEKFHATLWLKWHIFSFLKRHKWSLPLAVLVRKVHGLIFHHGKTADEVEVEESVTHATTREETGTAEGSWYGNDTIWRCIIDLNNIILFADKSGALQKTRQRSYLGVVDGLLGGEREGPMEHTPKKAGILIAALNPVTIDYAAAHVMGFDWKRIPQVREAFGTQEPFPLAPYAAEDVELTSNDPSIDSLHLDFIPTRGWKGEIERDGYVEPETSKQEQSVA